MSEFDPALRRLEALLERAEALLPAAPPGTPDWSAHAFRWRRTSAGGGLEAIQRPHDIDPASLLHVDSHAERLRRNTRQFLAGLPANNALLWGSRGTGKSSLVKALLHNYAGDGLRLVEVAPADLVDLPAIVGALRDRPEAFVLFCDDLSFEADDASYKALKATLDGALAAPGDNVLIYATSNRRHLLPEYQRENDAARPVNGEIHHGEAVEEKISLSERFGLWLSFYPFDQTEYLDCCQGWIERLGGNTDDWPTIREAALQYALERGSRSGRVAWQFARDYVGWQSLPT